jgi:signal peptidase I
MRGDGSMSTIGPVESATPMARLFRGALVILLAVLVFRFVLLPLRLEGVSMLPTYEDGSWKFANRLAYVLDEPRRGDIVAVRMAGGGSVYVKRIVGLPGERVAFVAGIAHVDGRPLEEPYVQRRSAWQVPESQLGPDEFFVVGDNRGMGAREHLFGKTQRRRIAGKLLW